MATTTFMGLTLPTPETTIGPTWANQLNTALTSIDRHDHTSGNGDRIPIAGLNINDNLNLGAYNIENVTDLTLVNQGSNSATNNTVFVKNGELYFLDGSGQDVQLTTGGTVNYGGASGNITGMTGSARVEYDVGTKTYDFIQDNGVNFANLECNDIDINGVLTVGGAITFGSTLTVTSNITSTVGDITASAGNIIATLGNITAGSGDITATSGNIIASAGEVRADTITDAAGTGAPLLSEGIDLAFNKPITNNGGDFLATGGYITNSDTIADSGTVRIRVSGANSGSRCGMLIATNSSTSNANNHTTTMYLVYFRPATPRYVFNSISTATGSIGGFSFSIAGDSDGYITLTNTGGDNAVSSLTWIGHVGV